MRIQRQGAVDPVPAGAVEEHGATMASMAGAEVPKTQIPRWIQLVGLPLLLLIGVDRSRARSVTSSSSSSSPRCRAAAEPAGARRRARLDPPRLRGGHRLPELRRG